MARRQTSPPITFNAVLQVALPAGVWAAGELVFLSDPAECRWCDRDNSGQDTLNGMDRGVRDLLVAGSSAHKGNARASDVVLYGILMPTSVLIRRSPRHRVAGLARRA